MSLTETATKPLKKVSPRKPIRQLDSRGERLCELMAFGTDDPEEAAQWGVPAHVPLSLKQAAPIAGLKMRNARFLFSETVFMREYSKALASAKSGHRARAIQRIADIMDNEGDGTAADRKVQLSAAQTLLSDESKSGGTNVNVTLNQSTVNLQPGIVVRLPVGTASPPLERMTEDGEIIEHDASPLIPVVDHSTDPNTPAFDERSLDHMRRERPRTGSGE